jgi:hypothetical protein
MKWTEDDIRDALVTFARGNDLSVESAHEEADELLGLKRQPTAVQVGERRVEYAPPGHTVRDFIAAHVVVGLAPAWQQNWMRVRLDDPAPGCDTVYATRVWAMTDAILAARNTNQRGDA